VVVGKDARVENVYGKDIILRSGAYAENIYGENVTLEPHCHVSREVQYTGELRINEKVVLSKKPQKVDALPQ